MKVRPGSANWFAGLGQPRALQKLTRKEQSLTGFMTAEVDVGTHRPRLERELSGNDRVIELGEELWGEVKRTRAIWLRPCYTELAKVVRAIIKRDGGSALIVGSRGIGKSVFGLLMVLDLVEDGKVILYEHQMERMVILGSTVDDDQRDSLIECLGMNNYLPIAEKGVYKINFSDEDLWRTLVKNRSLTHVQDLGDDKAAVITRSGNCHKIILTSPDHDEYSQLHGDGRIVTLFMPSWELWELQQARELCYPQIEAERVVESFEEYGGIIRFVLDFSQGLPETQVEIAFKMLPINTIERIFHPKDFESMPFQYTTGYFVHIVPQMYTGRINPSESLGSLDLDDLRRKYGNCCCKFASENIERRLAEQFVDHMFDTQKVVEDVPGLAFGHLTLPMGGRKRVRLLGD